MAGRRRRGCGCSGRMWCAEFTRPGERTCESGGAGVNSRAAAGGVVRWQGDSRRISGGLRRIHELRARGRWTSGGNWARRIGDNHLSGRRAPGCARQAESDFGRGSLLSRQLRQRGGRVRAQPARRFDAITMIEADPDRSGVYAIKATWPARYAGGLGTANHPSQSLRHALGDPQADLRASVTLARAVNASARRAVRRPRLGLVRQPRSGMFDALLLVVSVPGAFRISTADFAIALLDEAEPRSTAGPGSPWPTSRAPP